MDLPPEVLVIIFSYLTPNDVIEASAVRKLFYRLSRTNKLFVKKFSDSEKLYKNHKWIYCYYENVFFSFSNQLFKCLKDINEGNLFLAKNVIMCRMYCSVLPFCVWNHLFLCERSHYTKIMCKYCAKLYIKNKKISDHINDNLHVQIDYFPIHLRQGIIAAKK